MTLRVVRAHLNDHDVVAVNCSPLPSKPWTAIDLGKGWTIACREDELVDPKPMHCRVGDPVTVNVPPRTAVVTGGRSRRSELDALADVMGMPDLPRLTDEFLAKVERAAAAVFDEGQWRITSCDDDPYTGEAPEAWAYVVDRIDRYGFVDRIECRVDDTWRIRSLRDLLEAAGGDPL